MLPVDLRQQICIRIEGAPDGLPGIKKKLRQAQCHSALDSLRRALRLKSHMIDWRNGNARGQREGLRSRVQIDRIERDCISATAKYRAARSALEKLSNGLPIDDDFRVLLDSDVRSYADPDLEANNKKKKLVGRMVGMRRRRTLTNSKSKVAIQLESPGGLFRGFGGTGGYRRYRQTMQMAARTRVRAQTPVSSVSLF